MTGICVNDETALIVVDMQPDFMPGGTLEVPEGDEIVRPVAELMRKAPVGVCVATQDWHPRGHVSFASSHRGHRPFESIEYHGASQILWPDHCVQGTPGAELHGDLPQEPIDAVIRKGMNPDSDSYSAFRNNWNPKAERPPTGLASYLRERHIESVMICGLARDVCAKWTAEDAAEAGFDTTLLWDLTRAVNPDDDGQVQEDLLQAGVRIADSADIIH